ncbi:MAG: hypothetical protein ACKVOB_07630, partial [Sphingomonas sp.]
MTRSGLPLRFLAMVLGGWMCLRAVMIYADAGVLSPNPGAPLAKQAARGFGPSILPPLAPLIQAGPPLGLPPLGLPSLGLSSLGLSRSGMPGVNEPAPLAIAGRRHYRADAATLAFAALGFVQLGHAVPVGNGAGGADGAPLVDQQAPSFLPPIILPADRTAYFVSRWSGSAWFIARAGDGVDPGLRGGQLGGGQAGVRIAYALGEARRVSLVARVATPLSGAGREAAFGVEWRPTRLPVRLVAEQRIGLGSGNGGGGPSVAVIGGAGPAAIGGGFRLEGYGAAGVIRRARLDGFADGALRIDHPV